MKTKHWILFILLGLIWGSSFMWIEIGLREVAPFTLVAFRVFFGFLFGLVVVFLQKIPIPRTRAEWTPLIILGLTNIAIPFALITWGQKSIDSGVASILDATVPLFTILIAHFMLDDDKMSLPKVLGLLVGFAGVVVLLSEDVGSSAGSVWGQLAVILACVFYAGSSVYTRLFTKDTAGIMRSMGPLASSTVVMGVSAAIIEAPLKIPSLPMTWIALLWLGILGSGVAFLIMFYLMHEIGPTRATMVTYLFPLSGVTLGAVFLGEAVTWQIIVGAILIVGSLAIANWGEKPA
ncbi:MAG: DMT family transporter [Anaerolineales bacterium]|nr:DMT family transporter [Anaerolineales bacterium]